jgi:hypothetical protein
VNFEAFTRTMKANSPTIMSAAAIAGVVTTTVLAAKAAMKTQAKLVELSLDADHTEVTKETVKDTILVSWKFWIPTGMSAAATISCIVGANRVNLQRQAALVAAYGIVDTAFREYKDEVVKVIGEKKQQKIEEEVAVRQMQQNPPQPGSPVVITSGGDELIYDIFTGRYFRSNVESIRQAANQFNADLLGGNMCGELNEFYALLHLDPVDVGNLVGFNIETMVDVGFGSHLSDDGRACIAMFFRTHPKAEFTKI